MHVTADSRVHQIVSFDTFEFLDAFDFLDAIDFLWEIFFLGDWLRKETDGSEPCSEVPLRGDSILPIQSLAALSTYVQSLEPSIQGSTKLGLVETGFNQSFRYRLTDSLFQQFPGFYRLADFLFHQFSGFPT